MHSFLLLTKEKDPNLQTVIVFSSLCFHFHRRTARDQRCCFHRPPPLPPEQVFLQIRTFSVYIFDKI